MPDKVEKLKQSLLLASKENIPTFEMNSRAFVERSLKSFPTVGIRSGGFRYLQRDTIPTFLDYLTSSVCSLLAALD